MNDTVCVCVGVGAQTRAPAPRTATAPAQFREHHRSAAHSLTVSSLNSVDSLTAPTEFVGVACGVRAVSWLLARSGSEQVREASHGTHSLSRSLAHCQVTQFSRLTHRLTHSLTDALSP